MKTKWKVTKPEVGTWDPAAHSPQRQGWNFEMPEKRIWTTDFVKKIFDYSIFQKTECAQNKLNPESYCSRQRRPSPAIFCSRRSSLSVPTDICGCNFLDLKL